MEVLNDCMDRGNSVNFTYRRNIKRKIKEVNMKKLIIGVTLLLLLLVVACKSGSEDAAPEAPATEQVN